MRTVFSREWSQSVRGRPPQHVINGLGFHSVIGYYISLNQLLMSNAELPGVACQFSTNEDNRAYTLSQFLLSFPYPDNPYSLYQV